MLPFSELKFSDTGGATVCVVSLRRSRLTGVTFEIVTVPFLPRSQGLLLTETHIECKL